MAYPFTVSRSTRQPQTPVRVNRKWLSRGLVASFNAEVGLPKGGMHDLARHNDNIDYATYPHGVYLSRDEIGTAWENDYGNAYAIKVVTTPDLTLTGPMTFEALVKVKAFQTAAFPYIAGVMGQFQRNAGDTADEVGPTLRFNNNATLGNASIPSFILFPSGGGEVYANGAAQSTNTPIHLIGVYNGSNLILWVNGVKTVGDSFAGSHLNNGDFLALLCEYIASNIVYGNRSLNGKMYFANIYNRGLTDAEAIERTQFPWDHLVHESLRPWRYGTGAGGSTVDATATGATVVASSSAIAGALTAASAATAATIAASTSAIAGAATGASESAAATVTATASATNGAATASAQNAAATVAATASATGGAATAASATTAATVTASSSALAGAASGTASGTATGATIVANASIIVGAATAASAVASALVSAAASAIAGSATGNAAGTANGAIVAASVGAIAGAMNANAEASGQTVTVATSAIAGALQADYVATGAVASASATAIPGAIATGTGATAFGATATATVTYLSGAIAAASSAAGWTQVVTAIAASGVAYGALPDVDPRYLVPSRNRRFMAHARGRRFNART